MSECVVRMEKPENCCECQLRQEDYEMGEEFCPFTGVECLSIGRQNNCPIICQLPEGHGRLIDADALRADYFVTSTTTNTPLYRYVSMEQIANAPTVEPASPWHRVEEPPKEEGRYLVASRWGKDNHWSYDLAYYTTKLEDCCFFEDGICGAGWHMWSDYEDCDIRVFPDYWMPIEPPKEDA